LANVLTYYPRQGYEFRESCTGAPKAVLSEALAKRDFKAKPAPTNTYQAYEDEDYINFMYETLYKKANLGVYEGDQCKNLRSPLTQRKYIENDCAQDGYTMMLCRSKVSKAGGRRTRKNRY